MSYGWLVSLYPCMVRVGVSFPLGGVPTVADPEGKIRPRLMSSLAIDLGLLQRRNKRETLGNILNCTFSVLSLALRLLPLLILAHFIL